MTLHHLTPPPPQILLAMIENMPVVIQWFTHLIPLRHFLVILRSIFLKGMGWRRSGRRCWRPPPGAWRFSRWRSRVPPNAAISPAESRIRLPDGAGALEALGLGARSIRDDDPVANRDHHEIVRDGERAVVR